MQAILISIGSELASGRTLNTNAAFLARRLQRCGIPCRQHLTVPDERALILEAVRLALRHAELLIITGGLGPTFDDITMATLAEALDRPLVDSAAAAAGVRRFYRRYHRRVHRLALRQAALPEGAQALPNPIGTAPGLWLQLPQTLVVALPGVPREMEAIVEQSVLPRVRRLGGAPIASRTVRTIGLVELQIQLQLDRLAIPPQVQVGLYPNLMAVDVHFTAHGLPTANATRALNRMERALRRRLGAAVYGIDDDTLEAQIGRALLRRRATLAVAESCTGGLVAHRITNVVGSSRYFLRGAVAYQNEAKRQWLGVKAEVLARHGAVSAPVARTMAVGIRAAAGADVGLSITGIAGPSGGTPRKPVGLVYMGLADRRSARVARFQFHGDRLAIKEQAAQMALDLVRRWALKTQ